MFKGFESLPLDSKYLVMFWSSSFFRYYNICRSLWVLLQAWIFANIYIQLVLLKDSCGNELFMLWYSLILVGEPWINFFPTFWCCIWPLYVFKVNWYYYDVMMFADFCGWTSRYEFSPNQGISLMWIPKNDQSVDSKFCFLFFSYILSHQTEVDEVNI